MSGRVAVMRWVFGLVVVGIVGLQPARAGAQPTGGGLVHLTGVVMDEQGNPIVGANVKLEPIIPFVLQSSFNQSSGNGGTYVFNGMAPREYRLQVSKEGYEPYEDVLNIAGNMQTIHNVVLKRKVTPGFILYINGGFGRTGFTNAEEDVCTNKVIPDFNTAGYNDFSCAANSVSNKWHAGVTVEKNLQGRFGLHGGVAYRELGGPQLEYRGTRVQNQLSFQGGGNYDLKTWQVSIGPSFNINDNLAFSVSALGDWWTSDFDIRNQLQSAGQVVSESDAAGSRSGFAVNVGAALDWYVGGGPVGLRVEGQSRRIDDVVKTDVTGLPKNDRGYTLSAGVVVRLR